MRGPQHGLLQPDSMENQGSQQAQTGDFARLLDFPGARQADPEGPSQHGVRQGGRCVKYNA
ncbi:uncharacterized protein AruCF_4537 [Achromobacter ruhlandii]|nr:uncharacterized protein AruCF_4537 [Achromobacter ruhlandii]